MPQLPASPHTHEGSAPTGETRASPRATAAAPWYVVTPPSSAPRSAARGWIAKRKRRRNGESVGQSGRRAQKTLIAAGVGGALGTVRDSASAARGVLRTASGTTNAAAASCASAPSASVRLEESPPLERVRFRGSNFNGEALTNFFAKWASGRSFS